MRRAMFMLFLILALVLPAAAAAGGGPIHVIADGHYLGFDLPPLQTDGRVLVPFRWLAEFYGWQVQYHPADDRVTATSGTRSVSLEVGRVEPALGLDVAPRVVDGRTLVPLRFVAEALGATVDWDDESQTVTISGLAQPPAPIAALPAEQVRSVKRAGRNYKNLDYLTFERSDPAGAQVIDGLVTAWQEAIPAVRPDLMPPMPPYGQGLLLEMESGNASVFLAWVCRESPEGGRSCTGNDESYVYLYPPGQSGRLVYSPALAAISRNYPAAGTP